MRYRKYWKKILPITMAFTLAMQTAAYAEVIIPPSPFGNGGPAGVLQPGGGLPGAGLGGGTLPGPGAGGGNAAGPGAANQQNGSGGNTQTSPAAGTQQGQDGGSSNGTGNDELKAPVVSAEGAVLMDGATGKVLFGKNQDQQFYPASITKVMTALLVLEKCNLNDTVTFSATATTNLESGAVSLDISEGDQLTVEQSLYGLLLKSANEIGNGLAEHVAGSISGFADMMNARARELGCKNTNFVNPHGLNNSNHKTTPYDMALILRAALRYETFRKIDTTLTYEFPAVKKAAAHTITMGHKMMYPSDSRYYEGIIGGKTGYTSLAGNTLVTGAERNGVQLIAVVMKSSGTHYQDTKAMLDYGFANYTALMGGQSGASVPNGSGQITGPGSGVVTSGGTGTQNTPSQNGTSSNGSGVVTSGGTGTQNTPSQSGTSSNGSGMVTSGGTGTQNAPSQGSTPSGSGAAAGGNGTPSGSVTAGGSSTPSGSGTAAGGNSTPSGSGTAVAGNGSSSGGSAGPGAMADGWHQNDRGWYYVQSGAKAVSSWRTVDGLDYWFGADGYMVTGWYQSADGAWYYFKPSIGYAMKNSWVESNGKWYYLGSDGILLTNTTTPDGYKVDGNGVWIQ